MMVRVTLAEAQTRLDDLVDAALNGEPVFIRKDDRQVVQLTPVPPATRQAQFGSAHGLIAMADDFDAPLEDFDAYTR